MQLPHLINLLHREMTAWRQDLHAHPELGFEEHRTSEFVPGKFAEFGPELHRNIGKTGAVISNRLIDSAAHRCRSALHSDTCRHATCRPMIYAVSCSRGCASCPSRSSQPGRRRRPDRGVLRLLRHSPGYGSTPRRTAYHHATRAPTLAPQARAQEQFPTSAFKS